MVLASPQGNLKAKHGGPLVRTNRRGNVSVQMACPSRAWWGAKNVEFSHPLSEYSGTFWKGLHLKRRSNGAGWPQQELSMWLVSQALQIRSHSQVSRFSPFLQGGDTTPAYHTWGLWITVEECFCSQEQGSLSIRNDASLIQILYVHHRWPLRAHCLSACCSVLQLQKPALPLMLMVSTLATHAFLCRGFNSLILGSASC